MPPRTPLTPLRSLRAASPWRGLLCAWGLALVSSALSTSTARAAERAALLPLQAPSLLPSARAAVEGDIRALLAQLGYTVQPAEVTTGIMAEAFNAGLDCQLEDPKCVLKVALAADVDVLVFAFIEQIDDELVLRARLLDVQSQSERRRLAARIAMPASDGGTSLTAAVRWLVTGEGRAPPVPFRVEVAPPDARLRIDGGDAKAGLQWLVPGAHRLTATAPAHVDVERPFTVSVDGDTAGLAVALQPIADETPVLFYSGLAVTGAGVLGAGSSAVVAGVIEGYLSQGGIDLDARKGAQSIGVVALVGAGLGTAVVAGGALMALWGWPEHGP